MNPSTPSIFARPLFAFFFGIALLIAAATYASRAHADVTINFAGCSSVVASGSAVTCYTGTAPPPATPPPPPSTTPTTPSGPVACAGFAKTVYVDMAWGTTGRDVSTQATKYAGDGSRLPGGARFRGLFGRSGSAGLHYLMVRGDQIGRCDLARQAGTAPQQAQGQLNSENASGGDSRIGVDVTRVASPLGCGRCWRGFSFIAIQI